MRKFYVITIVMAVFTLVHFYSPFQVLLFKEMGLTIFQLGLVFGSFHLIALFIDPIVGKHSDRVGRKKMILSGMFLRSLAPGLYTLILSLKSFLWLI